MAGVYVQAISAYAPHPNAAKLWMEYLYSDEGQLTWMKGYCHPIREADLRARGVVPDEIAAKLPDVTGAVFPTVEQLVDGQARHRRQLGQRRRRRRAGRAASRYCNK
jgi:putative spermidine/putrescine transport system substrate-binding protein